MSAFACELLTKAIRLTRMDEARRNRDLFRLCRDMPEDRLMRNESDFPIVGAVLEGVRLVTGRWRNPAASVEGPGIDSMFETGRALDIDRAANVLLDEAEMTGPGALVNVDVEQVVGTKCNRKGVSCKHKLHVKATETPSRRRGSERFACGRGWLHVKLPGRSALAGRRACTKMIAGADKTALIAQWPGTALAYRTADGAVHAGRQNDG